LASGDPTFCSLIHRDTAGSLWLNNNAFVELTNLNIGGLKTKGIDVNGSYAHKFSGYGTLNVSMVGTWLDELSTDTGVVPLGGGGNGVFDCAGLYGATCGTPNPEWRHKLRVGFTLPDGLGLSGQWRYFSSVKNDTSSSDPDIPPGDSSPADAEIGAQSYFDLALTARLADKYNFRLGANNIFDKEPPIKSGSVVVPPFGNGNTFPQVYDALGRYIFAGVTIDF
jgi:outer membrane receptor protein involved in Fe transport